MCPRRACDMRNVRASFVRGSGCRGLKASVHLSPACALTVDKAGCVAGRWPLCSRP